MSNKDIPTFESNVNIKPAAIPNVQSDFGASASIFGKISQSALAVGQRVANQRAALEGEEAGQEPGLKLEPPVNEATAAFNRAATSSNKSFLDANISKSYRELYQRLTQPKNFSLESNTIEKFNAESGGLAGTFLKNALPENKLAVQNAINYYHGQYATNIQGKLRTLAYNTQRINQQNELNGLQNEMAVKYFENNTTAGDGFHANFNQILQTGMEAGTISVPYAALQSQTVDNIAHTNQIMGGMHEALASGGEKGGIEFLNDAIKSTLPKTSMTPIQKDELNVKMQSAIAQHQGEQEISWAVQKAREEKLLENISKGNPVDSNRMVAQYLDSNQLQRARSLQKRIVVEKFVATVLKSTRNLSPAQRQSRLLIAAQLIAKRPSGNNVQLINRLRRASQQQVKLWVEDPAAMGQATPQFKSSLVGYQVALTSLQSATDPNAPVQDPQDPSKLIAPKINSDKKDEMNIEMAKTLLAIQTHAGTPFDKLSLLSGPQAAAFVATYNTLDPAAGMVYLGRLFQQPMYRGDGNILFRDLKKAGLHDVGPMIVAMGHDPKSASKVQYILAGQAWTAKEYTDNQDKIKKSDFIDGAPASLDKVKGLVIDATKDYETSITNASNGDSSTQRGGIRNEITRFAYALRINNKAPDMKTAVTEATEALLTHNFNFTTVDNTLVRVSSTVPKEQIPDYLNQAKANAIDSGTLQVGVGFRETDPGIGPEQLKKDHANWLRSQSHWAALPDTMGFMLLDSKNNPVMRENGKRVIVTNKEVLDPTSLVNQQIDSRPIAGQQIIAGATDLTPADLLTPTIRGISKIGEVTQELIPLAAKKSIRATATILNDLKEAQAAEIQKQIKSLDDPARPSIPATIVKATLLALQGKQEVEVRKQLAALKKEES